MPRATCIATCYAFFALVAVFAVTVSAPAFAAPEKPELILKPGEPIVVKLADGRVAQIDLDRRQPFMPPLVFEVTENTCTPFTRMRCVFTPVVTISVLALRWKTHPDPKKVGQIVLVKRAGLGSVPMQVFDFLMDSDRKKKPLLTAALPKETLSCDDYRWVPGADVAAPSSISMHRWDVEAMMVNPETGLMENRTLGVSLGVQLQRAPDGKMVITDVKRYVNVAISIFNGDTWSMAFRQPSGEVCLVSAKAQFASVVASFIAYFSQPFNWKPYAYKSDEYTTTTMYPEITRFLKSPQEYELQ